MTQVKRLFKLANRTSSEQDRETDSQMDLALDDEQDSPASSSRVVPSKLPRGTYYTRAEDKIIVKYVTYSDHRFLDAIHLSFWVVASKRGVCPGRSAASLHERWRKLSIRVNDFGVSDELAKKIKKYAVASMMARRMMRESIIGEPAASRGPHFTRKENKAIIKFMNDDTSRDKRRNSLELWGLAVQQKICPGRSANSLMIRYRRLRIPPKCEAKVKVRKTSNQISECDDDRSSNLSEISITKKSPTFIENPSQTELLAHLGLQLSTDSDAVPPPTKRKTLNCSSSKTTRKPLNETLPKVLLKPISPPKKGHTYVYTNGALVQKPDNTDSPTLKAKEASDTNVSKSKNLHLRRWLKQIRESKIKKEKKSNVWNNDNESNSSSSS